MKKLSIFLIAFTFFAFQASAAVTGPIKPNAKLQSDLINLIGTECDFEFDNAQCTAEVLFTVNSKGEVIVISVNSSNTNAEVFIKNKINYKKVGFQTKKEGELYLLPLKIVK